ncbi:hypothetical protein OAM69_07130 [bacterium]|nr:hypothetical protein [bacterium]
MTKPSKPKTIIHAKPKGGEKSEVAVARTVSSPEFNGAYTNNLMNGAGSALSDAPSLDAMIDFLEEACKNGDTGEKALTVQAITLDKLFNHMVQSAFSGNSAKPIHHIELWLKFALRAQSQCRATYEAISNIRHPRVQYVAGGHMQVNNTRTSDNNNAPNELTEQRPYDLCQNTEAPTSASREKHDSQAVVEIDRPANS